MIGGTSLIWTLKHRNDFGDPRKNCRIASKSLLLLFFICQTKRWYSWYISSASLCEVVTLKHDDLSHQPGIQKVIILMRIMLVMMMTILLSSMKTMSNNNDNADGNYLDAGKDLEEYDAPLKHESTRIFVANLCLLLSLLETSSFQSSWWTWPLKDYQNIARIFSMFTQL